MNRMRQAILDSALGPVCLSAAAADAADVAEQRFCFGEDFLGFDGHFPGYPILPAILQTLLGQLVAEQLYGGRLVFQKLSRAKFTRELRPGEQILVRVVLGAVADGVSCAVELRCGEVAASSFTLNFAARGK